jgi:hypothetical protein
VPSSWAPKVYPRPYHCPSPTNTRTGVVYNVFFLSYIINPKICHRFVGMIEEEAVHT